VEEELEKKKKKGRRGRKEKDILKNVEGDGGLEVSLDRLRKRKTKGWNGEKGKEKELKGGRPCLLRRRRGGGIKKGDGRQG